MFREMRRKKQKLSDEESIIILKNGSSGVLALSGDDDYPYALPISYVYCDGRIYFHGAKCGYKIDAINKCGKASFCVVDKDEVVPEKYTTYFRSVIVFGKIRVLEDDGEIRKAISALAEKYNPDCSEKSRTQTIEKEMSGFCVMELDIEHMTGKEAVELVRRKQ